MGQITLRGLREGEQAEVLGVLGGVLESSYPGGRRWLQERLKRAALGGLECVVAREDGVIVGACLVQLKARGAKIGPLWVRPDRRRQGVGSQLVSHAVEVWGESRMYLTCPAEAAGTFSALLAPAGFELTAVEAGRYGPGRDEAVFVRGADERELWAISLSRPWSELVVDGVKGIENRSWRTRQRGVLVVHGAQTQAPGAQTFCAERGLPVPPEIPACPTGYLGIVRVAEISCSWEHCQGACSPWAMEGSWHWRVLGAERFPEVIPGRGQVGLWGVPSEVEGAARKLLSQRGAGL